MSTLLSYCTRRWIRDMTYDILKNCILCPRRCGADRTKARGRCGAGALAEVALMQLHKFEEPFLSGTDAALTAAANTGGSGTVFFRHCALGCVYCQNHRISVSETGEGLCADALAEVFLNAQKAGAFNVNMVTPTHYTPHIVEAVGLARKKGLSVPIVWNTSGYEEVETVKSLHGTVDIYLTDYKYKDTALAARYSNAPDYHEKAALALAEMVRQTGAPRYDGRGMMTGGTGVRHLTLPGALYDSKAILSDLHARYGNSIVYSIMNQYTPMPHINKAAFPELARTVSQRHYAALVAHARGLGIENAVVQEGGTQSESFIPDFSR